MSNNGMIFLVGAIDCNDGVSTNLESWSLGKPTRSVERYGGPMVDIATAGAVDLSDWAEAHFFMTVSGDDSDTVNAVIAVIAGELAALADITFGVKGSVYVGTLVLKNADCIEQPSDVLYLCGHKARLEIVVEREPWIYGAAETLINAVTTTLPAVVDLSAQTGQAAAPPGILADAGALNLACFYAGAYPDATATIDDFVRELHALTWTGAGDHVAEAAGWPDGTGDTCWAAEGVSYTPIDVTAFEPGEYQMFCKAKTEDDTDPGTIGQQFGDTITLSNEALDWIPLGLVTLPAGAVRGAATSTVRLTITGAGAGKKVFANAVAFIPTSFGGFIGWSKAASTVHTLRWEGEIVYADDIGDLGNSLGGRLVKTLGGCLVCIAEQAAPASTTDIDLTISATPRWEQLPSAGITTGPSM